MPFKKGKDNINWKGGKTISSQGYVYIYKPYHPFCDKHGYIFEHRLVMEKKLGRYLTKDEAIHHIDFDKTNNNINNLHLFPNKSKHMRYHEFLKNCVRGVLEWI